MRNIELSKGEWQFERKQVTKSVQLWHRKVKQNQPEKCPWDPVKQFQWRAGASEVGLVEEWVGAGTSNQNYFCDIFCFESAKRKIGQDEYHKVKGRKALLRTELMWTETERREPGVGEPTVLVRQVPRWVLWCGTFNVATRTVSGKRGQLVTTAERTLLKGSASRKWK